MFIVVPRNSPVNIFGGDSVVTNRKKLRLAKKIIDVGQTGVRDTKDISQLAIKHLGLE